MKKIKIYIWMLLACVLTACSGNDDVDYVAPWTEEYELPQGKSDADDRIVDYYNRYGSYILYEYSLIDFRYEVDEYSFYNFKLPDPAYVGNMLDLLEDIWFDFYPDEFHKKYMPLKIMLTENMTYENSARYYFTLTGESAVGIGWCSDTLREITPTTKLEFKNELQGALWEIWTGKLEFPEEFFAVSDYSIAADDDPASENYARKRGFVAEEWDYEWSMVTDWETGMLDEQKDLKSFLTAMITRTSAEWKADLQYPLVREKYDILRNWIQKTYGFDLQKIGDTTYE